MNKRIIIGVTGASGVIMSYYLLKALRDLDNIETHLIISKSTYTTWKYECDFTIDHLKAQASYIYEDDNIDSLIASGSFLTEGMIVLPCSMKTLAGISSGYANGLLNRAVDVCLKENRNVVLCPREIPLGKIHLKNLLIASDLGCTIIPPMLTFYNQSINLEDQINHIIGKILIQFNLMYINFKPWKGDFK